MPKNIIEQPEDLLPLDRLLFELRYPADSVSDTEADSLRDIIKDAVGAVAYDASVPILPEIASVAYSKRVVNSGFISYGTDPFALNFISTRHPVAYATSTAEADAGVYENILNIEAVNEPINEPASVGVLSAKVQGGLPSNAQFIQITYRRGLFADSDRVSELRTLAILKARSIYDGVVSVPDHSRSAYERVLAKARYEGALPLSFNRLGA